jgi:hypothetical protein
MLQPLRRSAALRPELASLLALLYLLFAVWACEEDASPLPVEFLSQARFIEANAQLSPALPTETESASAADWLLFDESVELDLREPAAAGAIAEAAQRSVILESRLEATGSVHTSATFTGVSSAVSGVELGCLIHEPSVFSLEGEIYGRGDADARVWLRNSSGQFIESLRSYDYGNGGPGGPFSTEHFLDPGEYTVEIQTRSCSDELAICGQAVGWGSFEVSLSIVAQ